MDEKAKKRAYLSTISTNCNPDLLVGQACGNSSFIRGNLYFLKQQRSEENSSQKEKEEKSSGEDSNDDDDSEDEELDTKINSKNQRYWEEGNITIKCHNCRQFGHIARECPNETKLKSCILCGEDTHNSFDCNKKMCFKCNKVGHQAKDCTERNIVQCRKCNSMGHREHRCLKEWEPPGQGRMKYIRCIECRKFGHIKCTRENTSKKIKIDHKVMNDLSEFIRR